MIRSREHARASVVESAGADVGAGDELRIDRLWYRHRWLGDGTAREQLILHFSPLVKYVVGRVAAGMPSNVDRADLHSYGILGLIDAIERHDPDEGGSFEAYAVARIRGTILDELRAMDWVPRSVREDMRRLEEAIGQLQGELQRTPEDHEIASWLDWDADRLATVLERATLVGAHVPLAVAGPGGRFGGAVSLADTIQDLTATTPDERAEEGELRGLLRGALRELGDRERSVLLLYYYEGLTFSEVADALQMSLSRVCQVHAKAVLSLRAKLDREG